MYIQLLDLALGCVGSGERARARKHVAQCVSEVKFAR